MKQERTEKTRIRLRSPRAAAIAGILFAVLYGSAVVMIRLALAQEGLDGAEAFMKNSNSISTALSMIPLSGLAFLWFIGVVRERMGEYEDKFFATIFLGSGYLYLGMVFVAAALAGGLMATLAANPELTKDSVVTYSRIVMKQITGIYALRMASTFMISFTSIFSRLGLMPRWVTVVSLTLALALMFSHNFSPWLELAFPIWVLTISVFILISNYRNEEEPVPSE